MTSVMLEQVREKLESLKLRHMRQVLDSTLEEAAQSDRPPLDVLERLLSHELDERWSWRVAMARKTSGLPAEKTLESFNFSFQPGLDKKKILELSTLRFIANRENVIFLGPPGVGKTHLAAALGLKAVEKGHMVLFIPAHELILRLRGWAAEGRLLDRWRNFRRFALLVIDEMGYLPVDADGASLLFQLVAQRYESGSMVMTSNLSFGDWGSFLGSNAVAGALLDRLLHHGTVVNIRGESYRLKEKKKAGLLPSASLMAEKS